VYWWPLNMAYVNHPSRLEINGKVVLRFDSHLILPDLWSRMVVLNDLWVEELRRKSPSWTTRGDTCKNTSTLKSINTLYLLGNFRVKFICTWTFKMSWKVRKNSTTHIPHTLHLNTFNKNRRDRITTTPNKHDSTKKIWIRIPFSKSS